MTEEDRIFPVYCLGCRAHISRVDSNAGGGMCEHCLAGVTRLTPLPLSPLPAPPQPNPLQNANALASGARARQSPAVLADPKYLLNTGAPFECPACGSSNVLARGKPGSGMGFFGPIGWVVGAMFVDALIQSKQPMVYGCNYCGCNFQA